MKTATLATLAAALTMLATSCIFTAPVSFAWRSNSSQQYATTDGMTYAPASGHSVNADKTTETQAAITASGNATTAPQNTTTNKSKEQTTND